MKDTSPKAIAKYLVNECVSAPGPFACEWCIKKYIHRERAALARLAIKVDPYLGSRSGRVIARAILARNKPPKEKP